MGARPLCVWCRKRGEIKAHRPFCSERCKLADLGRWLSGGYAVAGASERQSDADEEDRADTEDERDRTRSH